MAVTYLYDSVQVETQRLCDLIKRKIEPDQKASTKLFLEHLKKLKDAKQGIHKSSKGSNRLSILEDFDQYTVKEKGQQRKHKQIDEFRLLTEIVKKDRDDILFDISRHALLSVLQRDDKDKKIGDTLVHYAVLSRKVNFILRCRDIFENDVNTRDFQGNTPLHFACLIGDLDVVKALLTFDQIGSSGAGTAAQAAANPGAGNNSIELCPKNAEDLIPLHLAIARGHFFIVQHLLCQEQVVLYLMMMPYELYQCLKFAISNRSIQILNILCRIFEEQICDIFVADTENSFWEICSFKKSDQSLKRIQKSVIKKLDPNNDSQYSIGVASESSSTKYYSEIDNLSGDLAYNEFDGENDQKNPNADGQRQQKPRKVYSLLHYASSCGDLEIFETVYKNCSNLKKRLLDPQAHTLTNETPLHFAVSANNLEVVRILIDKIREIKVQERDAEANTFNFNQIRDRREDSDQQTELNDHLASDQNVFRHCLDEVQDVAGHSPFFVAVMKGYIEVAEILLEDDMSNIGLQNNEGDTPLHWAVMLKNAPMVQFLLDRGADMRMANTQRNNVVMIASINQRVDELRILLNHPLRGKNNQGNRQMTLLEVQQQNVFGNVPTLVEDEEARERARRDFLKTVINEGNQKWMTSMHAACLSGNVQIVQMLLYNGADLEKLDQNRFLPLHYAVVKDNIKVVELLKTDKVYGINVIDERYNCKEYRIMSLAILNGAYECIKYFVYLHAPCNVKEPQDYTYLHMAAMSGHVNIFLYFLSKQVSLHATTVQGLTAFQLAERSKNTHLIEYLRSKFDANSVLNRQSTAITQKERSSQQL